MVVSGNGKINVNSGKRHCGVCGKGVQTNAVNTQYIKSGFTSGVVVYVVTYHLQEIVLDVSNVTVQFKKLISLKA